MWLWLLAVLMAYITAELTRRASNAKSALDSAVVFFILAMMAGMFAGAVLYLQNSTLLGLNEALALNMGVMTVGAIAVLRYWTTTSDELGTTAGLSPPAKTSDELELERSMITTRVYVVYFLVMMASMTAIGIIYVIDTAMIGLEEGLIVGNAIMTAGVLDVLRYAFKHNEGRKTGRISVRSPHARATLISLVLLNEFLMGWTFVAASTSSTPIISSQQLNIVVTSTFTSVAGSDWFLFTMVLEMILSIYMLRREFTKEFVELVLFQSSAMFFVPTAIKGVISWSEFCIFFECAAMLVLGALAYEYLYRNRISGKEIRQYLFAFLIFYSVTIVGLVIWILLGNSLLLLVSIIGAMVLYFDAILAGRSSSSVTTEGMEKKNNDLLGKNNTREQS